jgi:uncharacterized protein YecE (DUF72 family)
MAAMTFPLFDVDRQCKPLASRLAPVLRSLAEQGVYFGTSSWKYEGWLGSIYTPERYVIEGKFSRHNFETECLKEYAATFPIVCGEFAFYWFPTPDYWKRLFESTPSSFLFGLKVPEKITVAKVSAHARYGARAGKRNEGFLSTDLFKRLFAERLEPYAKQVANLIFEFGTFSKSTFPTAADFFNKLDGFLAALPTGFRYAVETRNPECLSPDYFAILGTRNVAHVFNAVTHMPPLSDQIALPGAFTTNFTVVRALLSCGRTYARSVKAFEPYRSVQEPDLESRDAMRRIVDRALTVREPAFVYVNNRLEGNAPETIEAVISAKGP